MTHTNTNHAIVRPPGESYVRAISSSAARIDVALARAQHAEYCAALREAGAVVETLPPDERYPDSCFMQDPAVVIAGQAIIGRMGAESRQGEEAAVCAALAGRFPLHHIVAPGSLEGGDVMVLPDRVLVGRSGRSNEAGTEQLDAILTPYGLPVSGVPIHGYLHLLTAATYLGHGMALACEDFADHPALAHLEHIIAVPQEEAYAANALALGDYVIIAAGHTKTAGALRACGFSPLEVPMSEFAKADGGITCLSLVW